jgi:hypothetical protein
MTTENAVESDVEDASPSTDDESNSSAGEGAGAVSPPASAPPRSPGKPDLEAPGDDADLKDLIREQNKMLGKLVDTSVDTNQKTRELHEGILTVEDEDPDPEPEHEVSIVEPTPPPQPHAIGEDAEHETKPQKSGWKRFY